MSALEPVDVSARVDALRAAADRLDSSTSFDFSHRTIYRAVRTLKAGKVERYADRELTWRVPSASAEGVFYDVQVIEQTGDDGAPGVRWVTCACANGEHLGGGPVCFHAACVALIALVGDAR